MTDFMVNCVILGCCGYLLELGFEDLEFVFIVSGSD